MATFVVPCGEVSPPLSSTEDRQQLREFAIKLTDAYCVRLAAERRGLKDDDPLEPQVEISITRSALAEDGLTFGARLVIRSNVPIDGGAVADIQVTVHGTYASEQPLDQHLFEAFTAQTPLLMLWPYARAYFSTVGQAMGLSLPLLPTLDALAPVEPADNAADAPTP